MSKKAVILLSGGLDSATVLAIANKKGFDCHAISVIYGQKHKAEIEAAKYITNFFGATHKVVSIDLASIGGSALTDEKISVGDFDKDSNEIPNTYVPARNTIFLSIALGYAEVLESDDIFIGACQKDYSGYPDCRDKYLDSYNQMANLATKRGVEGNKLTIHAPLLNLTKAETIITGTELGVDYSKTISCYRASDSGKACGTCDSCTYRKIGFQQAGITDPTPYCL